MNCPVPNEAEEQLRSLFGHHEVATCPKQTLRSLEFNFSNKTLTAIHLGSQGFGSTNTNNNSIFGQQQNKPAFGSASTAGGGLFGSTTATAGTGGGGFGGFGSTNTNNTPGGSLFGSTQKPAFGGTTSGTGLFNNASSNTGFGSTNNQTPGTFGSPFGQNNAVCEGTGSTPFSAFTEKEGTSSVTNHFQSISFMQPYKNWSFEVTPVNRVHASSADI